MKPNIVIRITTLCICVFWFGYGIWGLSTNEGLFHTDIYRYIYKIESPIDPNTARNLAGELATNPYVLEMPTFKLDKQGFITQNPLLTREEIQDASIYGLVLSGREVELNNPFTPATAGCMAVALSLVVGLFSTFSIGRRWKDEV